MREIWFNRLRKGAWLVLGLLLLGGLVELVIALFSTSGVPEQHMVTTITQVVVPPPPPPPPVPPPPQKMIQAPKEAMSPVKAPSKPSAVPKPPGNPLTTDGAVGKDAFGLAAGNGGGDTIGGSGGGGDPFGYFDGLLEAQFQAALSGDSRTRFGHYDVVVRVWVNADGQVVRAELTQSSGNEAQDTAITADAQKIAAGEALPQGMQQPIDVHVKAQ